MSGLLVIVCPCVVQLVQQYNLVLPDRLGAALTDEGTRDMEDGASGTTDLTLFYNNDLFQDLSTSGPQGKVPTPQLPIDTAT